MSVTNEIIELIPLLVQGKLNKADSERIQAELANSPELQGEYSFWQGVYSIRQSMPHFDFSSHPTPEVLDRFAQEKINQLSSEYSEVTGHLQQCRTCVEEIEFLRQAVALVPEDPPLKATSSQRGWFAALAQSTLISRIVAPVAVVLIIVFGAVVILNKPGDESLSTRIALSMQFEKRAIADEGQIPEMRVALQKNTRELVLAFPTDRVEAIDYGYEIDLNRRGGETIALDERSLACEPTEFLNQCELKVTDSVVLNTLKEGGSFSLKVREDFPDDVDLIPAEYEFYFNVSVK